MTSFSQQAEEIGKKLESLIYASNTVAWDAKILIKSSNLYANVSSEQELFCSLFPACLSRNTRDWGQAPTNYNNDKNDNTSTILIGQRLVSSHFYHAHIFAYSLDTFTTEDDAYLYGKQLLESVEKRRGP
jgi:hypothetical protein